MDRRVIHLDTHVVVWLYAGEVDRFPARVLDTLKEDTLVICPMVSLELQYLYEIGRLTTPAAPVVASLQRTIGLRWATASWTRSVEAAFELDWTRDPFDRLIVACALVDDASLITKDESIRANCANAVWE